MRQLLIASLAALMLLGCTEKRPLTVSEFMENEALLYGTLARCENQPGAGSDRECANARQAAERLAVIQERAARKAREQAFEAAREEYRTRLDRERELRRQAEAEAEAARLQALYSPHVEFDDGPAADDVAGSPDTEQADEAELPVSPDDTTGDTA